MPNSTSSRNQQMANITARGFTHSPPISPTWSNKGVASTRQHPLFLGLAPITSEAALSLSQPQSREWIDQLRVSKTIFLQLIRRATKEPEWPREFLFTSANGDVQADIAMANFEWRGNNRIFLEFCLKVYGITNMEDGSRTLPVGNEAGSYRNPYPFFACNVPPNRVGLIIRFPALKVDTDMLAILDTRGTVILNVLFHETEEQRAIIKLADAAMTIWKMWADTRPEPEPKCMPLNNALYRRYYYMLPLIREDVHLRLQHCIDRLPEETKSKYQRFIRVMHTHINTHRYSCNKQVRFDSRYYIQTDNEYLPYAAGLDGLRVEIERMLSRPDHDMDAFLASLKHYSDAQAPINERAGFLGGTEAAHIDIDRWDGMFKHEEVPDFGGLEKRGKFWFQC